MELPVGVFILCLVVAFVLGALLAWRWTLRRVGASTTPAPERPAMVSSTLQRERDEAVETAKRATDRADDLHGRLEKVTAQLRAARPGVVDLDPVSALADAGVAVDLDELAGAGAEPPGVGGNGEKTGRAQLSPSEQTASRDAAPSDEAGAETVRSAEAPGSDADRVRLGPLRETGVDDPVTLAAAGGMCVEWVDFDDTDRRRLSDIVGLEVENESLRAVAARVPLLESRLAELQLGSVDDDLTIDLREPRLQHP